MGRQTKFSAEVRERAVRLVREHGFCASTGDCSIGC